MKPTLLAAALFLALLNAAPARAQVFGTLGSAERVPMNGHVVGAYLNATDDVLGMFGQLRLSFYDGIDFGFQGGLSRVSVGGNDRTAVRLGTDVEFMTFRGTGKLPIDVAIGGGLGVESSDDYHVLTLMPSAVASHTFGMGQNGSFAPYVGIGLSFANVDAGNTKETFTSLPIRLGGDLRVMPGVRFVAEMQFGVGNTYTDDFGLATGVNLPF
jgi:opacity protein-like surface antigen